MSDFIINFLNIFIVTELNCDERRLVYSPATE